MNCPNCATEMESGYVLQIGFSGVIRVVKDNDSLCSGKVAVLICPNCGKIETFVDFKSIK